VYTARQDTAIHVYHARKEYGGTGVWVREFLTLEAGGEFQNLATLLEQRT
jgi:hypothetical protein